MNRVASARYLVRTPLRDNSIYNELRVQTVQFTTVTRADVVLGNTVLLLSTAL
jgi:hypothetical protein